jgi:hypothetical protein
VAGEFSSVSPFSSLFFYSQSDGVGEFYETDGAGGIAFLQAHIMPNSWSHIIPGIFCKPGISSGLFLYDQQARFGTFYDTQGQGSLVPLSEYNDDHHAWTHIVAGHLTNSKFADLLFYDQAEGFGALYSANGSGGMTLVREYADWRESWTHILIRRFREKGGTPDEGKPVIGRHDIFFYEGSTGYSEIYEVDNQARIRLIGTQKLRPNIANVIPGSFGSFGNPYTGLLMYDGNAGHGAVMDLKEGDNKIEILEGANLEGMRKTWDIIVPGNFWVADEGDHYFPEGAFTDLLFYDRNDGLGEFYLYEPPDSTVVNPLAGYASAGSVRAGERVDFFVSSQVGAYTLKIYRQAADEILMATIPDLLIAPSPLPIGRTAWRDGALWPKVASLSIPLEWPSGLYFARVDATQIVARLDIPFIVRAATDGNQSSILIAMNDTTYEAYNFWGGRSLYGFGLHNDFYIAAPTGPGAAEPQPWAFRVSFRRPTWAAYEHDHKWVYWEVPLIRWLARQGIQVEWCTLVDLHKDPNLLANYTLFVTVGHSEYWSKEMRENVVEFVNEGGNAAFFTGNTCWWRVRIENDGNTMVCYKDQAFDPADDPSTLTIQWPKRQAIELTGVSFYEGVVWVFADGETGDEEKERFQYIVQDGDHWVFTNTGLQTHDRFGVYYDAYGKQTVLGMETDANRDPASGLYKLALAMFQAPDAPLHEYATMGIFTRGGTVFTASTFNWTRGLSQNGDWGAIDQITRNVFDRLGNLRVSVRASVNAVRKAVSIKQLAHQRHETFPLSLREFVERIGNL